MCWPTVRWSGSSPRPGSGSTSTRRRTSPSVAKMSEPGPEVMARFVGPENVERGRDYLEQLDPELHRYIIDFVYGEVYAGDVLDAKTPALCTVAMLACRRQGAVSAGSPNAWNALATMRPALEAFEGLERWARQSCRSAGASRSSCS